MSVLIFPSSYINSEKPGRYEYCTELYSFMSVNWRQKLQKEENRIWQTNYAASDGIIYFEHRKRQQIEASK